MGGPGSEEHQFYLHSLGRTGSHSPHHSKRGPGAQGERRQELVYSTLSLPQNHETRIPAHQSMKLGLTMADMPDTTVRK